MYVGEYGCLWVFMGAVGCTITNAQTNNTKRDRNGLAGYDFPKKDTLLTPWGSDALPALLQPRVDVMAPQGLTPRVRSLCGLCVSVGFDDYAN